MQDNTDFKQKDLETELRETGKQSTRSRKLGMFLFKASAAAIVISFVIGFERTWWLIILFIAIGLRGLYIAGGGIKQKWKINADVSENYLRPVLDEFFTVREYKMGGSISNDTIRASGLIGGWNKKAGSDYISGSYGGVDIELCDMELINEYTGRDSDGHLETRRVTIFKGQWLVCQLGTSLPSKVIVRENAEKNEVRDASIKFRDDVDTENTAFEKAYQVEADDPHTAFMVLTPQFMEKLMEIRELLSGRFLICFDERCLHIAVDCGRDLFEVVDVNADLKDFDALRERFRGEIRGLTNILDVIFQNEKLHKGER